jgi:hypothetical protein
MSQERLDKLIAEKMGVAGREAKKRAAELETEVARLREIAAGRSENSSELEKIRGELAAAKIERDAIAAAAAQSRKEAFISSQVSAQDFVCDAETLKRLTQDDIVYNDETKTWVTAADPEVSAADYYKNYATARPWLQKGRTITGTGLGGSTGSQPPTQLPLEHYFGPKSNAAAINALSLRDPDKYKRLRAEAVKKGLI